MSFSDLIAPETLAGIRSKIIGFAQGAGLTITDWIIGSVGQQSFEAHAQTVNSFVQIVAQVTRGFASLDTSTDPGDDDPFDASNASLAAAPGYLTAFGANTFGTTRGDASFAEGFVTLTNGGTQARTFAPFALTFTWTAASPPSPAPTYRNTEDPSIYVNADGTVTLAAGNSITFPVQAEEVGTRSNAPPSALSLTTTLQGCSGTNAAAILGVDREARSTFITRCRQAPARISLGGPAAAYDYLSSKNLDGTPLLNANGVAVNISRTQTSESSASGIVNTFYATPAGAPISDDVTAANANIEAQAFAVPDAITFTGAAATEVNIHVAGTAKIKARAGVTATIVKNAIVKALVDAFETFPLGGVDQIAGAGVIYTTDLRAIAANAFQGLYDVIVTTPAGATTAIAFGHVATVTTVAGDWAVTIT